MPLPDVSHLPLLRGTALTDRFRQLSLDRGLLAAWSERGDDLRHPLTPTREALYRDDEAAVVFRLFFCALPEPMEDALAALGTDLCEQSLAAGLLRQDAQRRLTAPFHLRVVSGLYLFSDYLGAEREAVMGAGETTAVLYRASLPPWPTGRVLDLGCGAGTLALLLSRRSSFAVGTDINPRAVAIARANAIVNGQQNVEFREGDTYAPVGDEAFDLIVSQPPYYPQPAAVPQTFLHGGVRGDELSRRVLAGVGTHLTPEGRALLFTSWPTGSGPVVPNGMCLLELWTNRLELQGTRQSLSLLQHAAAGRGWSAAREVPADVWGDVTPHRLDALWAAEELASGPDSVLQRACLKRTPGVSTFLEGNQRILQAEAETLLGYVPVDESTWELLGEFAAGARVDQVFAARGLLPDLPAVRRLLRRGLLVVV